MNKYRIKKEPKKSKKKKSSRSIANTKAFWILAFLVLLFALLIIRLIDLNVRQGEELTRKALNQLTRTETISPDRGIIYDRNKKELAINVTRANVFYDMGFIKQENFKTKKEYKEELDKVTKEDAKKIAKILNIPEEEIIEKMVGKRVVKIASNVSRDHALKLESAKVGRVSIDDVTKRFYPYKDLAAHVIGFANDESTGVYGIESSYDGELSGMPGKNIVVKNNSHAKIPLTEEETYAPKEGFSTVLTLDETLQQISEEAAKKTRIDYSAEKVSIIIQDTKTGEILAMANNESYDLNNPKSPINEDQEELWEDLSPEEKNDLWFRNWTNFCVNEQFEPGSTFKLITTAAALEEATTSLNKTYVCNGLYTDIPGVKIGCTSQNRGPRTVEQAITESCNIALIKIGRELGAEKMYKYIKAFGFGSPTGIDLPAEATGQIARSAESMGPANVATISYGHGISVTPIQLINSVSAIANKGYLNTPRIVSRLEDNNGNVIEKKKTVTKRKVISDETSEQMRHMMGKVVTEGTGKRAQVSGYQIGGKTGTANIATNKGYENAYIASFVGVAPLNDPRITVLVVVQRPKGNIYGSAVATPAAHDVFEKSLEYLKVPKTEKEVKEEKEELVSVPNVRNLLLLDAGKSIVDRELKFNTVSEKVGNNAVVIKQNPQAGTYAEKGTIVDLEINNNEGKNKTMPILIGKTEKQVEPILKALKVEYNISGKGKVVSQRPEAGSYIKDDNVVLLTMESELYKDDKDSEDDEEDIKDKKSTKNNSKEKTTKKSEVSDKDEKEDVKKNSEKNLEKDSSKSTKRDTKKNS